jgi:hypothetical protein
MKVNVFGIGSAKCGTTTLFDTLARHPEICGSRPKEADFFANARNYEKGYQWYHETCFSHYSGQKLSLDVTPNYSSVNFEIAAKRIYGYNPSAKLIYLIRDPFERLNSEWAMCLRDYEMRVATDNPAVEWTKLGFSRWADKLWHSGFFRQLFYGSIINCYLKYFSRDSIYITTLEELCSSYKQEFMAILDFIGATPSALDLSTSVKSNVRVNQVGRFARLAPLIENSKLSQLSKAPRIAYGLRRQWFLKDFDGSSPSLEPFMATQLMELLMDDYRECRINLGDRISHFTSLGKDLRVQPPIH